MGFASRLTGRTPLEQATLRPLDGFAAAGAAEPLTIDGIDGVPFSAIAAATEESVAQERRRLTGESGGAAFVPGAPPRDDRPETAGPRRAEFAPTRPAAPPGGLSPVEDQRALTAPFAALCQIEVAFEGAPERRFRATGFRVGAHLVLTVAHALRRPDLGRAAAMSLYVNNGADRLLQTESFRVAPEWRRALEDGAPPLARDDYGVVFVAPPPTAAEEAAATAFPYPPIQAVDRRWFAAREAARYRLAGFAAGGEARGLREHIAHQATDFALPVFPRPLEALMEREGARRAAARFQRNCIRHRIASAPGFAGAPMLAAIPNIRTNAVYEAAVGLHLGGAEGLGVARIIDDEVKRRLVRWGQEARRLIDRRA